MDPQNGGYELYGGGLFGLFESKNNFDSIKKKIKAY